MVRERDLALTLSDDAVLDESCERGREGAVRDAQTASQLFARHAGAKRMGGVIRAELFASARGEGVPVLGRPDPPGDAFRRQLVNTTSGRQGGLQQRRDADAAGVLAQFLLQHVARRAPLQRFPHCRVMARVLAGSDVREATARHGCRRARQPQDEPVAGRRCDGRLQVQLHPAL